MPTVEESISVERSPARTVAFTRGVLLSSAFGALFSTLERKGRHFPRS